jgi:hypothetical protein
MADDDNADTEGMEPAEGASPAGAEFVPERSAKPKSDAYTAMLILAFLAFAVGIGISGREAWEHYDVQFGMFTKQKPRTGGDAGAGEASTAPPADAATPPAAPPAENP